MRPLGLSSFPHSVEDRVLQSNIHEVEGATIYGNNSCFMTRSIPATGFKSVLAVKGFYWTIYECIRLSVHLLWFQFNYSAKSIAYLQLR